MGYSSAKPFALNHNRNAPPRFAPKTATAGRNSAFCPGPIRGTTLPRIPTLPNFLLVVKSAHDLVFSRFEPPQYESSFVSFLFFSPLGKTAHYFQTPSDQQRASPVFSPHTLCGFSKEKITPFLLRQYFHIKSHDLCPRTLCKNSKVLCKKQDAAESLPLGECGKPSSAPDSTLSGPRSGYDDARGVERSREPIGRSRPRASPLFAEGTPKNRLPDP